MGRKNSPLQKSAAEQSANVTGDNNLGILPHNHTDRPFNEPKVHRKPPLRDHERGAKPGIKYHPKRMAMQAAPDHGDHE
jgi:hypothetical protein